MSNPNYEKKITNVPDFPKPGIQFKDISTLFEDPKALNEAIYDLQDKIKELQPFDKLVAADARGFLFGVPMALEFKAPLVLARKKGKLPRPGASVTYDLEYGTASVEISEGSIKPGDRVVIVDDLLATGGSAKAIDQIVRKLGGTTIGMAVLIELDPLKGRDNLEGIKVVSCIHYQDA